MKKVNYCVSCSVYFISSEQVVIGKNQRNQFYEYTNVLKIHNLYTLCRYICFLICLNSSDTCIKI